MTGAAAARLYDDHVDAVHELIARRVGASAAPAITQEAFELALRTWEQFDDERGTERLFVYGAATDVLRRHADAERAHLRTLRIPSDGPSEDVNDPLVTMPPGVRVPRVVDHESNRDLYRSPEARDSPGDPDAFDARVMRAVAELNPDDRDILLLSLWESCSQGAIAEVLELGVGNVRSSLGRVRRELKAAVAEDTT